MDKIIEKNIKPPTVLEEKDFKSMIESRSIDPADFGIIKELSRFSKDLFIDHHNYFSASRENTLRDLERDLTHCQSNLQEARQFENAERVKSLENRLAFLGLFVEFARKYDWCTCDNLNRVFERRKIKKK